MEAEILKVTYPHMGYLNIPILSMLNNLGVEVIEAPPISKKTVELGSLYSPEGVCLPYKINMGNFIESIDQGADTLVSICGAGKCRLGFYNAVQKIHFEEKGKLQFYMLNINHLFSELYCFLRTMAPHASRLAVLKNIAMGIKLLKALDAMNEAKNFYGARTNTPEQIIDICRDGSRELANYTDFKKINLIRDTTINLIGSLCDNNHSRLPRVVLIGEFYVLLEPYINHSIEDLLIKQGIEVKKFVYTGNWVYSNTFLQALGLYNEEKAYLDQAKPYLNYHVGGDGLKSVGSALQCARDGYDGIIHIYPFGCMPEVVAQSALKNIASDYNLPLLTLSIDEHSSDVGIVTRIEAFADCIKRKKIQH
jgi:predicted nucleotide-binding protein (sugar kinase/HSP70/actin superfamily)